MSFSTQRMVGQDTTGHMDTAIEYKADPVLAPVVARAPWETPEPWQAANASAVDLHFANSAPSLHAQAPWQANVASYPNTAATPVSQPWQGVQPNMLQQPAFNAHAHEQQNTLHEQLAALQHQVASLRQANALSNGACALNNSLQQPVSAAFSQFSQQGNTLASVQPQAPARSFGTLMSSDGNQVGLSAPELKKTALEKIKGQNLNVNEMSQSELKEFVLQAARDHLNSSSQKMNRRLDEKLLNVQNNLDSHKNFITTEIDGIKKALKSVVENQKELDNSGSIISKTSSLQDQLKLRKRS